MCFHLPNSYDLNYYPISHLMDLAQATWFTDSDISSYGKARLQIKSLISKANVPHNTSKDFFYTS